MSLKDHRCIIICAYCTFFKLSKNPKLDNIVFDQHRIDSAFSDVKISANPSYEELNFIRASAHSYRNYIIRLSALLKLNYLYPCM